MQCRAARGLATPDAAPSSASAPSLATQPPETGGSRTEGQGDVLAPTPLLHPLLGAENQAAEPIPSRRALHSDIADPCNLPLTTTIPTAGPAEDQAAEPTGRGIVRHEFDAEGEEELTVVVGDEVRCAVSSCTCFQVVGPSEGVWGGRGHHAGEGTGDAIVCAQAGCLLCTTRGLCNAAHHHASYARGGGILMCTPTHI